MHACDVLQTVVDMTVNKDLETVLLLEKIDLLGLFFGALVHDYKHQGYNNNFLINTKHDIAFQFNGKKH